MIDRYRNIRRERKREREKERKREREREREKERERERKRRKGWFALPAYEMSNGKSCSFDLV